MSTPGFELHPQDRCAPAGTTPAEPVHGGLPAWLDVQLQLEVSDGTRRFALDVALRSDQPFVVLYGPSGSGKTLTLQAIAGLLAPRAGHVRVGGQALYDAQAGIDLPAHERGIGYLFQDYALFPHLTVRQNVEFGLTSWRRRQVPQAAQPLVERLLDHLGLAALARSRPAALSGGQRQRVALARALACQPRLLLLDEPFASLNPMLRDAMRTELQSLLAQWQIPTVMITHDLEDALALADRVFVYADGGIARTVDFHALADRRERILALAG